MDEKDARKWVAERRKELAEQEQKQDDIRAKEEEAREKRAKILILNGFGEYTEPLNLLNTHFQVLPADEEDWHIRLVLPKAYSDANKGFIKKLNGFFAENEDSPTRFVFVASRGEATEAKIPREKVSERFNMLEGAGFMVNHVLFRSLGVTIDISVPPDNAGQKWADEPEPSKDGDHTTYHYRK